MDKRDVIIEVAEKYGEWLEMAGDRAPNLMIEILSQLLVKERWEKEFYKKVAYGKFSKI